MQCLGVEIPTCTKQNDLWIFAIEDVTAFPFLKQTRGCEQQESLQKSLLHCCCDLSLSSHEGFSGMPLQIVIMLVYQRSCASKVLFLLCHLTCRALEVVPYSASILGWTSSSTMSANNISGSFSSDHLESSGKPFSCISHASISTLVHRIDKK